MMIIVVPYSVMIGINTALETFVSRAAGRNNLLDCGLYLHRSILVITVLYIPVSLLLWNTESLLVASGISQPSAQVAAVYCRTSLPGVLLNSYADSIDLFLIPLGYSYSISLVQSLVIPVHIFFCYMFTGVVNWGVQGVAMAHNFTAFFTVLFLVMYVSSQRQIKEAWYFPTYRTFENLKEFLMIAAPGVFMLLIENTSM